MCGGSLVRGLACGMGESCVRGESCGAFLILNFTPYFFSYRLEGVLAGGVTGAYICFYSNDDNNEKFITFFNIFCRDPSFNQLWS